MNRYQLNLNRKSASEDVGDDTVYDEFKGKIIVVELSEINGQTEAFEGRQWLESKVKNKQAIGWDLEWQPDRWQNQDNRVALLQFADDNTALLVRTHKTGNWLPMVIMDALTSESCRKVGVGWDGPDKRKMEKTFLFLPSGICDLAEIAKKKAVKEQGLKSLTQRFGYTIRKNSKIARSNWATGEPLSKEQIQYAADDAYYSYVLFKDLNSLPDVEVPKPEGFDIVNAGILELKPGWEEQGIERKHDGLYCKPCQKGPMTVPQVVEKHMEGKGHKKKMDEKYGLIGDDGNYQLDDAWIMQGIVGSDTISDLKAGEVKCSCCDLIIQHANVEAHIASKKHQKKSENPGQDGKCDSAEQKLNTIKEYLWNLPDYVRFDENPCGLTCTICPSKADNILQMFRHLGGNVHLKQVKKSNLKEFYFVEPKMRLEDLLTGKPVVRSDHKEPRSKHSSSSRRSREKDRVKTNDDADPVVPSGWERFFDQGHGCHYYYNAETQTSQWELPQAKAEVTTPSAVEAVSRESVQSSETMADCTTRQVETVARDCSGSESQSRSGDTARTNNEHLPHATESADGNDQLPPGWAQLTSTDGQTYYADLETGQSQWVAPPPHVQEEWSRHGQNGQATWSCKDFSFREDDQGYCRLIDPQHRVYWTCPNGVRFFEPRTV